MQYMVSIPHPNPPKYKGWGELPPGSTIQVQIADQHQIGGIFTFYEYTQFRSSSVDDWQELLLQHPRAVIECGSITLGQAAFFEKVRQAKAKAPVLPKYKRVATDLLFRYDAAGFQFYRIKEERDNGTA